MPELHEKKKLWRKKIKGLFTLVPPSARRELDTILNSQVDKFIKSVGAMNLLGFAPLPDEPDIAPFLQHWISEGLGLALPVWEGGSAMRLRLVKDWKNDLLPDKAGIPTPHEKLPLASEARVEVGFTPGRAFSESGVRLGRGEGCYDALFSRSGPLKVGVCYDFQVFPELPAGVGDVKMDYIITPSRIVKIHD